MSRHLRLCLPFMALSLVLLTGCQALGGKAQQQQNVGTLSANPGSLSLGSVLVGNSTSLPETLTNTSAATVTISQANVTGAGFSSRGLTLPVTLTSNQSVSFQVILNPAAAGAANGTISIVSDASDSPLSVQHSGTGLAPGSLTPNPASVSFGNVTIGANNTVPVSVTNTGGSTVTLLSAAAAGGGFSFTGPNLPFALSAGSSATFNAVFTPTAAGVASGTLTINSDAINPTLVVPLSGTGLTPGQLSANPSSFGFGNVQIGTSTPLSGTLTNSGGSSLTISAASVSGSAFSLSGLTLPLTLTAGQSTSFTVRFSPTAAGAVNGNLTITSNGANPSLNVPLSGTGVPQGDLSPNPASISFGNVQVGSSSNQPETLTNNGGTSVTISAASASGSGFSYSGLTLPLTLTAGQSTSFTVKFAPTVAGAASGNLTITSNGSNPTLNIPLSGTGVAPGTLSPNPASLSFGSVQVGNHANLFETLTNAGGSSVTITQANVTGATFSISGLTLPTTLTPNQSVTFTATFAPTVAGSANGSLSIVSNASNSPLNIALSGTGTAAGQLAVSPTTLNFGNVTVGTSSPLGGNLNATGAAVTVLSAGSNSSEYVLSGITLPVTIPAGQSAPFTVTFTPNAPGTANASLTFTSNASNSPTVQSLTGNGQAPPQHWADLTWNASSGAVTYNVYRKLPTDPGYSRIDAGDTTTAYRDNNVTAGQTYDYVVTAVNAQNQESGYSNMAQAIIPSP